MNLLHFAFNVLFSLLLSLNKNVSNFLHLIYPAELVVKDTTASYLDLYLEHNFNGTLSTKVYDKRDNVNFPIVNYLFLYSNIPSSSAYGVYMSQLIRCSRAFNSYQNFFYIDQSC